MEEIIKELDVSGCFPSDDEIKQWVEKEAFKYGKNENSVNKAINIEYGARFMRDLISGRLNNR